MSGAEPDLSILIVSYNTREDLEACLASLDAAGGVERQTIVVDNASADGSAAMVRGLYPRVELIENDTNRGFAAAVNLAARRARGRHLLLLNPDTRVPAGTLAALVAFADRTPAAAAVGPRLRNPDGSVQRSCWRAYPSLGMALADALFLWKLPWLPLVRRFEYGPGELDRARPVGHLLGACMLVPRRAWEEIGELDESYFLYLEETDWCHRARAAGGEIWHLPEVDVVHRRQGLHGAAIGALKGAIALACLLRLVLWSARGAVAATTAAREQAGIRCAGYRQVLRRLPAL
jgi:GT2 family glycosyltransferase